MLKSLTVLVVVFGIISMVHGRCAEVYDYGVHEADKETILATHNELRRKVADGELAGQPRACNMKTMKWDDTLADLAQEVAYTCNFEHIAQTDGRWGQVGQNLDETSQSWVQRGGHWKEAIEDWFSENTQYTYSTTLQPNALHYTQVVWANTEYVGCAYVDFKDASNGMDDKFYVCNYGPSGNYEGELPYETGC